jgi:hypothetical protein
MTNIASNETAYPHRGGIFDLQYQAAWDTGNAEQEGEAPAPAISSIRFPPVVAQIRSGGVGFFEAEGHGVRPLWLTPGSFRELPLRMVLLCQWFTGRSSKCGRIFGQPDLEKSAH